MFQINALSFFTTRRGVVDLFFNRSSCSETGYKDNTARAKTDFTLLLNTAGERRESAVFVHTSLKKTTKN